MCPVCSMIIHIKGIAAAAYSTTTSSARIPTAPSTHRLTTAACGYFAPLYTDQSAASHNICSAVHFIVDSMHARRSMPYFTKKAAKEQPEQG